MSLPKSTHANLASRPFPRKLLVIAIAHAMLGGAATVHSATITVSTLGDGSFFGQCSLRDAIVSANSDAAAPPGVSCIDGSGEDSITFDPSILPGTIILSGSELLITSALTVQGPGLDQLTISGNNNSRVFYIEDGTGTDQPVTLDGLTITGGTATGSGGAIFSRESLTISDSLITASSASVNGGAVYNRIGGLVTVTSSTLSGNSATAYGGGIYNQAGASLAISNSTLVDNRALYGGGLYSRGRASLDDVSMSGNFAANGRGGAIASADASSTLTLANSILDNNSSVRGGAIHNESRNLIITDSTLSGNSAVDGGGIDNEPDGTVTLTNTLLSGNTASEGAGIANAGSLTVMSSTLSANTAALGASAGGGIANRGTATVTNSSLAGNSAREGAGLYNYGGALISGVATITGSTFSGNTASNGGGGIRNSGSLDLSNSTASGNNAGSGGGIFSANVAVLDNVTLSDNSASYGGGILSTSADKLSLVNSIIAGNPAGGDCDSQDSLTSNLNNFIGDGSCPDMAVNPLSGDPMIGPLQDNGGQTLTHALLLDSPAIDSGDNTNCAATDQRGFIRRDGACDIGAFEYGQSVLVVTTLADSIAADGQCALREAVISANTDIATSLASGECLAGFEADMITFSGAVLPGTITLGGDELAISSALSIQGPAADQITISAANTSRIFYIDDGDAAAVEVTLEGLTLADGNASFGGAIINRESLTVRSSTLSGNSAGGSAGALYSAEGTLYLSDSILSDNSAGFNGGGIWNRATMHITDSTLTGNSVLNGDGGGIRNTNTATITNSTLSSNSAIQGGGVQNFDSLTMLNSTVSGNSAVQGGGVNNTYNLTMLNSTVSGNSASDRGGGLANEPYATLTLTNSTLADNSAAVAGGLYSFGGGNALTFSNNIIANSVDGGDCDGDGGIATNLNNLIGDGAGCTQNAVNMVTGDPMIGALQDNGGPTLTQALLVGSPAIDAGDNVDCPTTDQRSFIRDDGSCDIGAVEFNARSPDVIFADGFE